MTARRPMDDRRKAIFLQILRQTGSIRTDPGSLPGPGFSGGRGPAGFSGGGWTSFSTGRRVAGEATRGTE